MTERTTGGKRIIRAPNPIGFPFTQTTSANMSVLLADNEDVEWHWTHLPNGSYVSGYTIRPMNSP
jgi:hypothetical protein